MRSLTIVGAGMAGLLAANMLHQRKPRVLEQQSSLPHNHSAVLRFKTSVVGDVLNIPFRSVKMIKTVLPWRNPVADALAYSFKNGGVYRSDRSATQGFVAEDRFIAPSDLIAQMAANVKVIFESTFGKGQPDTTIPVISTIPMPILMMILGYPRPPKFSYVSGGNVRAIVPNCDAYVSLLVPDPERPFSRISLMGDELIVECPGYVPTISDAALIAEEALELLGVSPEPLQVAVLHQDYAKINPIDDDVRKNFIHWASIEYNIYSLGRFATWRPKLQMDDLVKDVRMIDRWIGQNNKYEMARMQ